MINMQLPKVMWWVDLRSILCCFATSHAMCTRWSNCDSLCLQEWCYSSVPVKTTSPCWSSYFISVVPRQHMSVPWTDDTLNVPTIKLQNNVNLSPNTFCRPTFSHISMFTCGCIYICIYICVYVCMYVCILCIHEYTYAYLYVCIYICVCFNKVPTPLQLARAIMGKFLHLMPGCQCPHRRLPGGYFTSGCNRFLLLR
jgi:hypothetical protein